MEDDIIRCLCEFKRLFAEDGYNAYTGCGLVDSALYDLEYLPKDDSVRGKLADFIYWQTYYQQSDLILIGCDEKNELSAVSEEQPDMVIAVHSEGNGVNVRINTDGIQRDEAQYSSLNNETIGRIYYKIIKYFDKEDN